MRGAGKFLIVGATAVLLTSGLMLTLARRQATPSPRPAAAVPISAKAAAGGISDRAADSPTPTRLVLADAPTITVYKTPTCGCCTSWVTHLREHGFEVETHDLRDLRSVKEKHGISRALESCHTAVIDGYVVEGHVPADLIERLLVERPEIAGLAVPGMPMGSPGMEGPYRERYNVLAFDRDGKTAIFDRR